MVPLFKSVSSGVLGVLAQQPHVNSHRLLVASHITRLQQWRPTF